MMCSPLACESLRERLPDRDGEQLDCRKEYQEFGKKNTSLGWIPEYR